MLRNHGQHMSKIILRLVFELMIKISEINFGWEQFKIHSKTDDSSCFIKCGQWGGSCPEICGEGGFCCSGNGHHYGNGPFKNGNCPQAAIDAIDDSVISYRCAVPVPTTPTPPPEPVCEVSPDADPLEDEEYKIIPQDSATTLNWQKARQQCKSYGKHWDLAIFNYEREFTRIQKILKDNCVNDHAYWIGKGSTDPTESVLQTGDLAWSEMHTRIRHSLDP